MSTLSKTATGATPCAPSPLDPNIDPDQKYISGLRNAVRLEGRVGANKKVIYFLMSDYEDIFNQKQCSNIFSENLDNFLVNTFNNLNDAKNKYDFFFDIDSSAFLSDSKFMGRSENYKTSTEKLFLNLFKYDLNANKVVVNEMFKNVRFHYANISYTLAGTIMRIAGPLRHEVADVIGTHNFITDVLPSIVTRLRELIEEIALMKQILLGNENPDDKIIATSTDALEPTSTTTAQMKHLAYKLKNKYEHPDIKKMIGKKFTNVVKELNAVVSKSTEAVDKFTEYINFCSESKDKLIYYPDIDEFSYNVSYVYINNASFDIYVRTMKIWSGCMRATDQFSNMYLLRRILDKSYTKKCVILYNSEGSTNCIDFLMKNFDFKITHIANSNGKNVSEINTRIKSGTLDDAIVTLYPEKNIGCSNIKHFPENFA